MSNHINRGRRLTADEAAAVRKLRQQVELERSEISRRLHEEPPGPGSWSELHELRSFVQLLKSERERRGMTRDDVALRAGLPPEQIAAIEEMKDLNPTLGALSRMASAVGRHLMLGLSAGEPASTTTPVFSAGNATASAPTTAEA